MKFDSEIIVREAKEALGENLVSLILYGSQVRGDASPDSDWNLFLVVRDDAPSSLQSLISLLPRWKKLRAPVPVIFRADQLSRSFDSFALEFTEMAADRKILWGEDPFANFQPDWETLREELEREARQKLIALTRRYLTARKNGKDYLPIIRETVPGYMTLLRCTIMEKRKAILSLPAEKLLNSLSELQGLRADLWRTLYALAKGKEKRPREEVITIFKDYLEQAAMAVRILDEL
jgi:predicted nucleotidyltransferase